MTRSTAVLRLALAALAVGSAHLSAPVVAAQEPVYAESRVQDDELYTTEELDNLLAPVALYPDPILAELFVAATFPEQVALAHRYVNAYGTEGIDDQAWDVSVKSIARYSPVLNMLAERPNWATAVGRAYAQQPGDVMASVQSLRQMARAQGNLVTTDQQRVVVEREYIRIVPAHPRVIYVPVYDPYVVYYRPVHYVSVASPYWSFGVGYPIGVWLTYDLDWDTRVVYYHGWHGYGRRHTWYHVSRPFISFNSIYVGSHRTVVVINYNVRRRHVNYGGFGYYNTVHRHTGWDRARLPGRGYAGRGARYPQPDRYGVPSRTGSTYRPEKPRGDGEVPRVGGTASSDRGNGNGRPSRGNNGEAGNNAPRGNDGARPSRGNGNRSDVNRAPAAKPAASEDRVRPVRVGGNSRPLYPRGEDISSDRVRGGTVARRETGSASTGGTDNGTWNARPQAERTTTRPVAAPRGRDADPVRAPRGNAERSGRVSQGSVPTFERSAPRSEPRMERSAPRQVERMDRSSPRPSASSAPRGSAPRASAPRSSEPRASAPRSSAPRASAPRSGGGNGGRSSGGSAPRASRGGGRDRG